MAHGLLVVTAAVLISAAATRQVVAVPVGTTLSPLLVHGNYAPKTEIDVNQDGSVDLMLDSFWRQETDEWGAMDTMERAWVLSGSGGQVVVDSAGSNVAAKLAAQAPIGSGTPHYSKGTLYWYWSHYDPFMPENSCVLLEGHFWCSRGYVGFLFQAADGAHWAWLDVSWGYAAGTAEVFGWGYET